MRWSEAAERCRLLGLSYGEFCRRCGLSESAMAKGLRRDSKMSGAVRRIAEQVIAAAEQETAA